MENVRRASPFRFRPARFARRFAWVAAMGAAAGSAAAAAADRDAAPPASAPVMEEDIGGGDGDALFVGVCLSRSGHNRAKGEPAIIAVRHRLRTLNAEGGLDGRRFRLLVVDDRSTPEGALAGARALIADERVLAVIGPMVSDVVVRVRDEVANPAARVLFVSPTATRDGLVTPGGWLVGALWPDSTQARAMARYLAEDLQLREGTVLVDPQSLYSGNLAARFAEAFAELGGKVRRVALPADRPGELSLEAFAPVVRRVMADRPQFVYFPATYGNIIHFVRQAGRQADRAAPQPLLAGGDTWDNREIFQNSGWRLENAVFTSPFFPQDKDARVVEFTRAMAREGAIITSLDMAMGRDAATMVVEAMRLGGPTRRGVRDGWYKLRDLPLISGNTSVRENGEVKKNVLLLRIVPTRTGYAPERVKDVPVE